MHLLSSNTQILNLPIRFLLLGSFPPSSASPQGKGPGSDAGDNANPAAGGSEFITTYLYIYQTPYNTFISTPPVCSLKFTSSVATTSTVLKATAPSAPEATSSFYSLIQNLPSPTNLTASTVGEIPEWYTNPSIPVVGPCASVIVGSRAAAIGRTAGISTPTTAASIAGRSIDCVGLYPLILWVVGFVMGGLMLFGF